MRSRPIDWMILLLVIGWCVAICLFAMGCSYVEVTDGEFHGQSWRFGLDTQVGQMHRTQGPTTREAWIEGYHSNPQAELVKAAAEGAARGLKP